MNTFLRHRASAWLLAAAVLSPLLVSSCGGGGVGSGGTGRFEVGLAAGTVNGFGSVIVDGIPYDDRAAPVVRETAPGVDALAEVRFGDRVAIEYATPGVASLIRADAAVAGAVSSVGPASLAVLGQTVVVNSDGTAGPITQFGGGFSQASDARIGDAVEVHGVLVRQGASAVIQATRIDKLGAVPAYLRVTGIVGSLGSSGSQTLALGQLTVDVGTTVVLPAGTSLAVGQAVTVLAPATSLSTSIAGGPVVVAAQVRVRTLAPSIFDSFLSGSLASLDAQAKTFVIEGQVVRYAGAAVTPGGTALTNRLYVRVRGRVATDGALVASDVVVRDAGSSSEAELHGNVSGFDPATLHFMVRDVDVDATGASLSGCPPGGLVNGLYVELHGATTSTGVLARTVQCESEVPGSTLEREGLASAVDVAAKTFTLTTSSGPVPVSWSDTTFFGGTTASTLAGKAVEVQGSFVAGVLVATKIKVDD